MARIGRLAAVVFVFGFTPLLGAHPDHDDGSMTEEFKVGKNGDVNIRHDLAVGDVVVTRQVSLRASDRGRAPHHRAHRDGLEGRKPTCV